jgi:hypothetical protein
MVCSKAPEHNADHGETDEGSNGIQATVRRLLLTISLTAPNALSGRLPVGVADVDAFPGLCSWQRLGGQGVRRRP